MPSIRDTVKGIFTKDTDTITTNVSIIVTTDEGQYRKTIEVPGKVLTVGVANLSTNYSIDAGKDIYF